MIEKLVLYVFTQFRQEHGIELPKEKLTKSRINKACEIAIEELKTKEKTEINLPFIHARENGPLHLLVEISKNELEFLNKSSKTLFENQKTISENIPNYYLSKKIPEKNKMKDDADKKFPVKEVLLFLLVLAFVFMLGYLWMKV